MGKKRYCANSIQLLKGTNLSETVTIKSHVLYALLMYTRETEI